MFMESGQLWWFLLCAAGAVVVGTALYRLFKKKRRRVRTRKETVDATRYIVLNETGNILITSNQDPSKKLPDHTEQIFMEAVAQLCMITRAISTTIDPKTGKTFSIYNHFALDRVLTEHPLFALLGQETATYELKTDNTLEAAPDQNLFSTSGSDAAHQKVNTIYNSMLVAAQVMNKAGETEDARVGHLTLCCEHLMGIPVVTAVITHVSQGHFVELADLPDSRWRRWRNRTIELNKDTYIFDSPTLQKQFGTDTVNTIRKQLVAGKKQPEPQVKPPATHPA